MNRNQISNLRCQATKIARTRKGKLHCMALICVAIIGIILIRDIGSSYYSEIRMPTKIDSVPPLILDKKHNSIYTFVGPSSPEHDERLKMWADAWNQAGWNTGVLIIDDAKKHPNFKMVEEMSNKTKHHPRYYRYLAMSTLPDGGWFSETFVLPLYPNKDEFDLPNDGKFTIHQGDRPVLISGNKEEWNKITEVLLNAGHANDIFTFTTTLRQQNPSPVNNRNDVVGAERVQNAHKFGDEFCAVTKQKRAISFSDESLEKSGMGKDYKLEVQSFMRTWMKTCRSSRPVMHTFYEPAYKHNEQQLADLEVWKRAWRSAGWDAVVLALNDAKRHPLYEKFSNEFAKAEHQLGKYDRMCFYRWLAMAASGGGWMSDYDTYPVQSQPFADATALPNQGRFTGFNRHVPCLVAGSASEWDRMSTLLFNSYKSHTKTFWSNMLALEELHDKFDGYIHINHVMGPKKLYEGEIKNRTVSEPYSLKDKCQLTQGYKAIHFAPTECGAVGFCHKNRADATSKWNDAWRQQCME